MPDIRLSWLPNTEGNLAGYRIYAGRQSGVYTAPGSPLDVGNVTSALYPINADGDWFFAVTAYNTSAQESTFSAEVAGKFLVARAAQRGTAG